LLIGIAFGFSAGFLFTIGIISLISANSTIQTQAPVGNSAANANATPTPTLAPTVAATLSPSPIPTTAPTAAPTPANNGGQLFAADDPRFYIIVFIIFLILSGFLLLRKR
jgi:ABC-type transport system involved in multi-copper enzyme maturation permease subunit